MEHKMFGRKTSAYLMEGNIVWRKDLNLILLTKSGFMVCYAQTKFQLLFFCY